MTHLHQISPPIRLLGQHLYSRDWKGVGYTRVASDQHHVEDVLISAAIGVVYAPYFTSRTRAGLDTEDAKNAPIRSLAPVIYLNR
ncbi:hypothetical protein JK628_17695 [Shewanella sp. KX20019]|nr:hypothetical protein JK628_17695 [Shewanella sp. KX20019]